MAGGDGIDITFPTRANKIKPSPIDNIYANAVIKALTEDLYVLAHFYVIYNFHIFIFFSFYFLNKRLYKYELRIRPGATDSRYLREVFI